VATEDEHHTLNTLLTRHLSRTNVFVSKTLATFSYVLLALLIFVAVGLIAGAIAFGVAPLPTRPTHVSAAMTILRVLAAAGIFALPLLAISSFGVLFSTLFRNSASAIVGMLVLSFAVQIITFLPGVPTLLQELLLAKQFDAWRQLAAVPVDQGTLLQAAAVSAVYAIPPLLVGWRTFVRRDVLG
jgi:ABC-type transport system involved in multi-copper enzyme maturation permease subunit